MLKRAPRMTNLNYVVKKLSLFSVQENNNLWFAFVILGTILAICWQINSCQHFQHSCVHTYNLIYMNKSRIAWYTWTYLEQFISFVTLSEPGAIFTWLFSDKALLNNAHTKAIVDKPMWKCLSCPQVRFFWLCVPHAWPRTTS